MHTDQIVTVLHQFSQENQFVFRPAGPSAFIAHVGGQHGKWPVLCDIKDSRIHIYSVLPLTVPPALEQPVMEYLTRANCGLSIGNFEMDLSDGEVRFKSSLETADGDLTPTMVGALLFLNLHTTDCYLQGLQQVMFAGQTPAEAVQAVRGEPADGEGLAELLADVDLDPNRQEGSDD